MSDERRIETTHVISVRLPEDDYTCPGCGCHECPCHLYMDRRADESVDWEPVAAWYRARLSPDERFLLGEYGPQGDVVVELVLAPKTVERFVERERDREVEVTPIAPPIAPVVKVKKPKKTTARKVAAVQSRDDAAIKERPQDVTEFSLTSPTEKELKTMKRRK